MKPEKPYTDAVLVNRILSGNTEALEHLVIMHQNLVYNIAFRMLGNHHDSEDLTQEILLRVISNLSSFKGKSKLSTWIYRIAVNSILDYKKSQPEKNHISLSAFAESIHKTPDLDLPDTRYSSYEQKILVEETRLSCLMGMLLCLDRNQRIAYVIGELFGFEDSFASEILEISKAAFRKRLQRARNDLYSFMNNECGLINPANRCICKKKTKALIECGAVEPEKLIFVEDKLKTIKNSLEQKYEAINEDIISRNKDLMQSQPYYEKMDMVCYFKEMLASKSFNQLYSPEIN